MQTAITMNGGAFRFAPTTHQATPVGPCLTALMNLPQIRKQIDDAAHQRNAQVILDIAQGLAAADACETDRDLHARMQLLGSLVEQSRTFDDYRKALTHIETGLLRCVEEVTSCNEEARCMAIAQLAGWRRDTTRHQVVVNDSVRLHGLVDELLKSGRQTAYDRPIVNSEEDLSTGSPGDGNTVASPPLRGAQTGEQSAKATAWRSQQEAAGPAGNTADVTMGGSVHEAAPEREEQFASTANRTSDAPEVEAMPARSNRRGATQARSRGRGRAD